MRRLVVFISLALLIAANVQPAHADMQPARQTLTFAASNDRTGALTAPGPCWPEADGEGNPCETTNPHVTFWGYGDFTQACTYAFTFDWGDGTKPQTHQLVLFGLGPFQLGTHTFKKPGTFGVSLSVVALTSGCGGGGGFQQTVSLDGFVTPADWNTERVDGRTPGVEPLNVIISAESTVSLDSILAAMRHTISTETYSWGAVPGGVWWQLGCLSYESAKVDGDTYVRADRYWRLGASCSTGNDLSIDGVENHARLWHQSIPETASGGAWFVSASYETACVEIDKDGVSRTVPWKLHESFNLLKAWHCIDGSPGSYFANGYNRGARDFVGDIQSAAASNGWTVDVQVKDRPAGIGECHVQINPVTQQPAPCASFNGRVQVVTVRAKTSP